MTTTTQRIALDGITLAIDRRGSGDAPLVLVHGYTGSTLDWTDVIDNLAAERTVVAYDHRGHGDSTKTGAPESYSLDLLLTDLERLADALDLSRFDLLGHSMGGVIALRYTLAHSERVRSLVLMDTAAEPAGALPVELFAGLAGMGREQGMGALADLVERFLGGITTPVQQRVRAERGEVLAQRRRAKFTSLDPDAFEVLARELNEYPSLVGRLGEIVCPVTVIVGEHDVGLRPAADVLAEGIAGALLSVIPDAEHSPQDENRPAWMAAVEAHLARAGRVA